MVLQLFSNRAIEI